MSILVLRNYILTLTSPSLNCQKILPSSENVIPLIILMILLIRINGLVLLLISMPITTQKAIASTSPAGILQAPFYDKNQSTEKNYGGIGVVIGHEITHAFDSNGADYDENGDMHNWWTKADTKAFDKRIKAFEDQWNGLEIYGTKVNGNSQSLRMSQMLVVSHPHYKFSKQI